MGRRKDIRAVILAGLNKSFSAGADLNELVKLTSQTAKRFSLFGQGVTAAIEACPKPTIAAIHGYALGGGLELALACDTRLATYSAVVGLPEAKHGIIPGAGGTYRLARLLGDRARRFILSGHALSAKDAHRLGLIDEMVAEEFLLTEAKKLAATFFESGAGAQAQAKLLLLPKPDMAREARAFAACFGPVQRGRMEAFLS